MTLRTEMIVVCQICGSTFRSRYHWSHPASQCRAEVIRQRDLALKEIEEVRAILGVPQDEPLIVASQSIAEFIRRRTA